MYMHIYINICIWLCKFSIMCIIPLFVRQKQCHWLLVVHKMPNSVNQCDLPQLGIYPFSTHTCKNLCRELPPPATFSRNMRSSCPVGWLDGGSNSSTTPLCTINKAIPIETHSSYVCVRAFVCVCVHLCVCACAWTWLCGTCQRHHN